MADRLRCHYRRPGYGMVGMALTSTRSCGSKLMRGVATSVCADLKTSWSCGHHLGGIPRCEEVGLDYRRKWSVRWVGRKAFNACDLPRITRRPAAEIGRASCRERV